VNRILVPLDGSPLAEAALPLGRGLARDHEAALLLVRALSSTADAEADVRTREAAEAYLEASARDLRRRGLTVDWKVWYDDPARAIADAASFNDVDLIVMSTHGRGGVTRLLFGSVAESVIRTTPVPVVLVRGRLTVPLRSIGRILVPLDGSELSEGILPIVERLAGPFDFDIDLLRALEPFPTALTAEVTSSEQEWMFRSLRWEAETRMAKVAAPLEAKGLRVRWTVREGPAVDTILDYARTAGAGMIAMSTHGRSGLGRLVMGSVAERVLRAAPVPVVVWKAPVEA
jgi:nucleotide-binding universal stress UspA family protein